MSRDWTQVRALWTVKEVRAYLIDVHGLTFCRATLYNYAAADFMPLPLSTPGTRKTKRGPRAAVAPSVIDEWVAARFHLRGDPSRSDQPRSVADRRGPSRDAPASAPGTKRACGGPKAAAGGPVSPA